MVVQENIRKIAITEEQLASLRQTYNKEIESIKTATQAIDAQNIGGDVVDPVVVEPTAEVLESAPTQTDNLVNPFANDNVGSTNIFDAPSVAEPTAEAPAVDIFSQPAAEETPVFEAPISMQEVAPTIENPVVKNVEPAMENVEVNDNNIVDNVSEVSNENLDNILNDITKMQEEFADLNARMIRFGNNIDELLERIKVYLNNKSISNVNEVNAPVVDTSVNINEVVAPAVEPQINPVETTIQENVGIQETPNFDAPTFDEGVNIFDQPSNFVR